MQCSNRVPATSRTDERNMNPAAAGDDSGVRELKNDGRRKQPMALFERILWRFWVDPPAPVDRGGVDASGDILSGLSAPQRPARSRRYSTRTPHTDPSS